MNYPIQGDAFSKPIEKPPFVDYELRDHQKTAIDMVKQSIIDGKKRPIIAASTSFGKTVVAGHICRGAQLKGKKAWFLCDRIQLIEQSIDKFYQMGIEFGVRQDNHHLHNPNAPVQIASIQTLQSMVKKHNRPLPEMDLVIVDECVTGDVEILTPKGWVRFDSLRDEKVAQYEPSTGSISFVNPKRVIRKNYSGYMYNFSSDKLIDIDVTENHEMIQFRNSGDGYRKVFAKDISFNHMWNIKSAGKASGSQDNLSAIESLQIAYQADGFKHGSYYGFQFSKKRKIDRILQLFDKSGVDFWETKPSAGKRRFFFRCDSIFSKNAEEFIDLESISYEKAKLICEEIVHWDGHLRKNGNTYFSNTNKKTVDIYQAVCSLAGYKSTVRVQEDNRSDSYKDIYRLFISNDTDSFIGGNIKKKKYHYDGMVYCVEVPSSNILVRRRGNPVVIGNCHTQYWIIDQIIEKFNNIPIIGLSATPYSKGLGLKYNNLINPITTRELEAKGYLCPVHYFGGEHVNLSKVRSSDRNSYRQDDLARETDNDADRLTGCIIRNWLELGENSQTIAFSPTQNLSKMLVQRFNDNGISSEHVDCNFKQEERDELFKAHDAGEFKILSCSRLLNTGYDAPSVRCIIDCFPVKSTTTYVQRVGRGKRIFPGKEYCIYLDHADNFSRFGYQEDIVPESLDMGEKTHDEKELVKKEKKEPKKRECPQCKQLMVGMKCEACGFEVPIQEAFEDDGSDLQEITGDPKKANRVDSKEIKSQFLSELNFYAESKGYKLGWAANQYRQRYGCWPNRINSYQVAGISQMTKNWIKHQAIKYKAQQKKKG